MNNKDISPQRGDISKQDLIQQIAALDESGFLYGDGVAGFAAQLFARVPGEELGHTTPELLSALANNLARFIAHRPNGDNAVRVYNPDPEVHSWDSRHTIVEMVNDDMPFLVDTACMVLTEMGLSIHRVVHPVISVVRDDEGRITELLPRGDDNGRAESVIHIQIDRLGDTGIFGRVERRLQESLRDVRHAVDDWPEMRARAEKVARVLPAMVPGSDEAQMQETQDFLKWLADDHFTFLGYRKYLITNGENGRELDIESGSGLGILREQRQNKPRKLDTLSDPAREREDHLDAVIITKTNARSSIHRSGYMDYVGVLEYNEAGKVVAEHRFLGLFTSGAYNRSTRDIPLVCRKVRAVVEHSGLRPRSHEGKALIHILETLPRDELFQSSVDELYELSMGILDLQERPKTRLFMRCEMFGRFYSCMVFIPRDRFNTENREKIQATLKRALRAEHLDYAVHVSDSNMARLHVILRLKPNSAPDFDVHDIEQRIVAIVRSWHDELKAILVERLGDQEGLQLSERFGKVFPVSYLEDVTPWVASFDVRKAALLMPSKEGGADSDLQMSLYRPRRHTEDPNMLRFKVFRRQRPLALNQILPMLEGLGLRIVSERPYELQMSANETIWIQDLDMVPVDSGNIDLDAVEDNFQEAFRRVAGGEAESDALNRLVLSAQMNWRQVGMLRAYCRYLQQTDLPLSQNYIEETLARHPILARLLVTKFETLFTTSDGQLSHARRSAKRSFKWLLQQDSSNGALVEAVQALMEHSKATRDEVRALIKTAMRAGLDAISSQDEDRILRGFLALIKATLRTNFYQLTTEGEAPEYLCFKLDSALAPELPKPRPFREIWVYSPRVEGVHLRAGEVARGGLRWSDRREDFRAEILGLMKAQRVKNTLIVPVGAKGGFVVKRPPSEGGREAMNQEVVHCYRTFITALLAITDNRKDEQLIPPNDVVRRDGDDPYLVVAADKGTATFSDIANGVAQDHEFWLDDAFASGGSNGYDHKGMGITAKGAWECVKRHFREMGVDTQTTDFTVVGVGDMSGDVFGNGMLLSRHIRLQAAFNHLHIFIDPNPDSASSFEERQRLFDLPRSTWDDYNRELISRGGGIWSRSAKTIELTPEIREWLGINAEQLTPQELIRELLKAPMDLFWNGGIGTYVKATTESHADVSDRANNAVRVNANELRCKVVGEGGNLGLTQKARIEFALNGGRINTDFVDNSAGVDCSDHEVNIKILLSLADGLSLDDRNQLLRDMKVEVEDLVLRSNYLQSQAITQLQSQAHKRMGAMSHLISTLERRGLLDREVEDLPDNESLRERMARGEPLTRPEMSVLVSYGKIFAYQELLDSDVPEDPFLTRELVAYFPTQLREQYRDLMDQHPLKREIIATVATNSMVNRMGPSFALRVQEDTGADIAAVAKAYTIAREVFAARNFWRAVEALDNHTPAEIQIQALMRMWDLVRHATRWFLNLPGSDRLDIEAMVERYAVGISELREEAQDLLPESELELMREESEAFERAGFPPEIAAEAASLRLLTYALDVVEEAAQRELPVREVLRTYFAVDRELDLAWLRAMVEELPTSGHWDANARGHLRTDLQQQHRQLTGLVLSMNDDANAEEILAPWQAEHHERIARTRALIDEMRGQSVVDFPSVTVAVRSLAQLVNAGGI